MTEKDKKIILDGKKGQRIKELRLEKGFSKKRLAEETDVPFQIIYRLEKDSAATTSVEYGLMLAHGLGTTVDYLITGKERYAIAIIVGKTLKVIDSKTRIFILPIPEITWQEAGKTIRSADDIVDVKRDWWAAPESKNISCQSFGLRMQGDSMLNPLPYSRSFFDGDKLFFDPTVKPQTNDLVLARNRDDDAAIFRQLVIDCGVQYLSPLNPKYPSVKITKHYEIIATLVDVCTHFARQNND